MKRSKGNLILIFLILLTVLSAVVKVGMGLNIDEMYVVTMGIRILSGDRMFAQMWELHMTSAWSAYLGLFLLRSITGGLGGGIIFLRILSIIIQFAVSIAAYVILKRWNGRIPAALAALIIANFLPRVTQTLEYGVLQMLFVVMSVVLLYDVVMKDKVVVPNGAGAYADVMRYMELVLAGILYSLGVLEYPTIILSFPVLLVGLYMLEKPTDRHDVWKTTAIFSATCVICGLMFIIYIMSYMTPQDFVESICGMLMDGSHTGRLSLQLCGREFVKIAKRSLMILIAAAVIYAIYIAEVRLRKSNNGSEGNNKLIFPETYVSGIISATLLSGAVMIIAFNVTGLRPSGPLGLQTRYILAAAAAVYFVIKKKDRLLLWLFILPCVAIYAGVMLGSNQGFESNASFLYLAIIAMPLVMTGSEKSDTQPLSETDMAGIFPTDNLGCEDRCHWEKVCVVVFIISLIFCRGYLVNITGTGPANIMEERVRIDEGILAGIMVYPDEAESIAAKETDIKENTDETDIMLYLGSQALCNTFTNGTFTSATCISTPVYDEEWVKYYKDDSHPRPTVVFVDRDDMKTWEDFAETTFGEWLTDEYKIEQDEAEITDKFIIIRLR